MKDRTRVSTSVEARDTGGGKDLIYMRGRWQDYTKSTQGNNNTITFTRLIGGLTETVVVFKGSAGDHDTVIFADGSAQTNDAYTTINSNPNAAKGDIGGAGFVTTLTTPLISDAGISASIATLQTAAASDHATLPTPLTDTVYQNTNAKNVLAAHVSTAALNPSNESICAPTPVPTP